MRVPIDLLPDLVMQIDLQSRLYLGLWEQERYSIIRRADRGYHRRLISDALPRLVIHEVRPIAHNPWVWANKLNEQS